MSNSKSKHCKLKVCECEKEGLVYRSRAALCSYWDVPATDFGNMIGPIGWLESPHGAFRANPDFHLSLPPKSLAWSIPVFLGTDKQNDMHRAQEVIAAATKD